MLIKRKRIPFAEIIFPGLLPSVFKRIIYRYKGYFIGKGVKIGFGSVIIGKKVSIQEFSVIGSFSAIIAQSVDIGRFTTIGSFTYINCIELKLGDDSKIREQVYIGGTLNPDSDLIIGKRCSIGQSSYINPSRRITIGDDTAIGGSGFVFTHASWQSVLDGYPVKYEPVTIESNVYIAWRVFILPGITIGANSTISADSTVTINVPPNSLAFGSPLKIAISGTGKWPRTISLNAKIKIIEVINDQFSDYLNFNGFNCVYERDENHDKISLTKLNSAVYFCKTKQNEINILENCTYLFINDATFNTTIKENTVVLNIEKRTRLGSNKLGEEYIRYLSRFGIRFERI